MGYMVFLTMPGGVAEALGRRNRSLGGDHMKLRFVAPVGVGLLALLVAGCTPASADGSPQSAEPVTVNVAYFPNLTHAPAIVGLADDHFSNALGDAVTIETATFNSGTEEIEALFAGAVDIGFIGPSPTVSGWQKSNGEALQVIAGAAANGASLVVREGIDDPADLTGTVIATPSLGNTQDVAARFWLSEQGFTTDTSGGGDVSIQPQDNATALTALQTGDIDGAWVPEPWATRMTLEAGAHVLVDESELWPDGMFVTTNVIVRTEFLKKHPDLVSRFIDGLVDTIDAIEADPEAAQQIVTEQIGEITGSKPNVEQLVAAWDNVVFTWDPLADTLVEQAAHATAVGLLDEVDLDGLYALDTLNAVLAARGLEELTAP